MIVLFTDFGLAGPYTGQMKAVLHRLAPGVPVVDLFADAPSRNAKPASYLLAAYGAWFPPGTVLLAVVDPGVGGARAPLLVEADGRLYVGPDNGLFELVRRRAPAARTLEIIWRPETLSASFHGRDLFAPVAAMLARGDRPACEPHLGDFGRRPDWPDDLAEIVYIDHYGNALTGLRRCFRPRQGSSPTAARSLAPAPSPPCRPGRRSGTRIPTVSPRSPSILAGRMKR
jgi:S-adenosyl-L-methionine hydrolase (adenosine-forming)